MKANSDSGLCLRRDSHRGLLLRQDFHRTDRVQRSESAAATAAPRPGVRLQKHLYLADSWLRGIPHHQPRGLSIGHVDIRWSGSVLPDGNIHLPDSGSEGGHLAVCNCWSRPTVDGDAEIILFILRLVLKGRIVTSSGSELYLNSLLIGAKSEHHVDSTVEHPTSIDITSSTHHRQLQKETS